MKLNLAENNKMKWSFFQVFLIHLKEMNGNAWEFP